MQSLTFAAANAPGASPFQSGALGSASLGVFAKQSNLSVMSSEQQPRKPSLQEEFRQWLNVAPRVWLVLGAGFLLAVFLGFLLGVLFMLVAFY